LEVVRCEQTMALAEAERASVARRGESEGPDGFELAHPRKRAKCSASGRLGLFLQAGVYTSNKPRASKLEADGVETDRERQPCE
jgi:hypothetical protein